MLQAGNRYLQILVALNVILRNWYREYHRSPHYRIKLFSLTPICYCTTWDRDWMMDTPRVQHIPRNGKHHPFGDWAYRRIRKGGSISYFTTDAREALKKPFNYTEGKVIRAGRDFSS